MMKKDMLLIETPSIRYMLNDLMHPVREKFLLIANVSLIFVASF